MTEDRELLRQYADEKSEPAFSELVRRHIGLVYSIAHRRTNDAQRAAEVTHEVFVDLARKASQLKTHRVLIGWLYRSAQLAALAAARADRRRRLREEQIGFMQQLAHETSEPDWDKLRPELDEALNTLNKSERDAVLLRFFEARPFAEIGALLELSENAARMRVSRALEKMALTLGRRGITSTTAALGVALGTQASLAVPAGLTASVATTALSQAATQGGAVLLFGFLTMTKLEVAAVGVLFVAGGALFTTQSFSNRALAAEARRLATEPTKSSLIRREPAFGPGSPAPASEKLVVSSPAPLASARHAPADFARDEAAGLAAVGLKPRSEWKNAGRTSPEAALETMLWSILEGDFATLATTLDFAPEASAKLNEWFATLPSEVREKYGDPRRIAASVYAESPDLVPTGFRHMLQKNPDQIGFKVVTRNTNSSEPVSTLDVLFSFNSDADKPATIPVRHDSDGWRCGKVSELTVERLIALIDPLTGEPLPVANHTMNLR